MKNLFGEAFKALWLPFLIAVLVIGTQVYVRGTKAPAYDEFRYLEITRDLNRTGVFSDGPFRDAKDQIRPGRIIGPAYPALLSILSKADPALRSFIDCHGQRLKNCPGNVASLYAVQTFLASVSVAMIFLLALRLSRSVPVAWLTMLIVIATSKPAHYATTYLTENLSLASFYAFMLFTVLAFVGRRRLWFVFLAGLALGLATLARPTYQYLFVLMIPLLFLVFHYGKAHRKGSAVAIVSLFVIGGLVVTVPWAIRNFIQFGDPALTSGYAPFILAQRLAYNQMNWSEWAVAWIYWLPEGDNIAELLFQPPLYERLGWKHPQSFFQVGNKVLFKETLIAAPSPGNHLRYLLDEYLISDLLKHILVSFPLSMRGLWASKILALIGVILFWPAARSMVREGRLAPLILLVLPSLFMVGLHGFVSVSVPRYNTPLIAIYAYATAYYLVNWWRHSNASRSPKTPEI